MALVFTNSLKNGKISLLDLLMRIWKGMDDMDISIKQILETAKCLKASDIHITVGAVCRYRVNGQLKSADDLKVSAEDAQNLVSALLTERAKWVLAKKGEVTFCRTMEELGRYRIHILKQQGVYGAVIHVVNVQIPTLEEMKLPDSVCELIDKKKGLILVTGPAGMGKSTTIASFLNAINQKYSYHIVTLEHPIEYIYDHVNSIISQREIGADTLSYTSGLQSAMAEDADVILVGELKDAATLEASLYAAENGCLVFSSLHTIGAAVTMERMINMFPQEEQQKIRVQLSSVLEAVISKQLIPGLDEEERVPAYEVLCMTPAIRSLVKEGKMHQIASGIQGARKQGMQLMDDSIYDLYAERKISAENALRYAQDAVALERKL